MSDPINLQPLEARLLDGVNAFDATQWDALVGNDNPFLAHAFLAGLEEHDCLQYEYGWQSCPIGLYDSGKLIAAAPLYLKGNSHGEFVFDWSWAAAYQRNGLDYYPKLLCAVPYSPVTGPRLLAGYGEGSELRFWQNDQYGQHYVRWQIYAFRRCI